MLKMIPFVSSPRSHALLALCLAVGLGCSNDTSGTGGSSSSASTGSPGSGGSSASGGASSASSGGQGGSSSASESVGGGGSSSKAGSTSSGGKSTGAGGSTAVDTSSAIGGKGGTGGSTGVGGNATGGSATGGTSKTGGTTGTSGTGGTTAKTGGSATGGGATGGTAAGGTGGGTSTGAPGGAKASDGCGKAPPTLKSATVGQATPVNTISGSRQFLVRWPTNYDNTKPYRLHIGLHGANGDLAENGKDNFGLWSLSKDTTIFVTLAGVNKLWEGPRDLTYADEVLKQVESELCIDTSRIFLEGFSMGAAMSWYITCSRPGVYRGVVGHSGGGVSIPSSLTCSNVAYLGSLGTGESGNGQNTQTDRFAKANDCTIENLPTASTGKHVCTPYKGCKEGFPTTWCSFDGGHGFTPKDSGASTTWVPQAAWDFISPL